MLKLEIQNPNKIRLWTLGFGFCLTFGLWILALSTTNPAVKHLDVLVRPVYAQVSGGDIETHLGGWPFQDLGRLIAVGVQTAITISGILILAYLIYGGIQYLIAAGDKEAMEKSQRIISNAMIGLVIVVAAFAIVRVIELIFGVQILSGITLPRP